MAVLGMKGGSKTPVLLITDIGRDIDDTLAVLALAGYEREEKVEIVAVVTTGGVPESRARLMRAWLRRIMGKEKGQMVPVGYDSQPHDAPGKPQCFEIPGTDLKSSALEANLYKHSPGPNGEANGGAQLIIDMCKKHRGKLHLIVISPMTPLANALQLEGGLEAVREGVVQLHLQGQAIIKDGAEGQQILEPDFAAFNMSEDKRSSALAFEKLQDRVPFRLLGKHAAYRVSIFRKDIQKLDEEAGNDLLSHLARVGLEGLKKDLPAIFDRLYPMPAEYRDTPNWYEHVGMVSHPYDPTLVVAGCNEDMFGGVHVSRGDGVQPHVLIGYENVGDCGVKDPDQVLAELMRITRMGLQRTVEERASM